MNVYSVFLDHGNEPIIIQEQTEETAARAVLCQKNCQYAKIVTVVGRDGSASIYLEASVDESGFTYAHKKMRKQVEVREMWRMLVQWKELTMFVSDLLLSSDASVYFFLPTPNGVWLYFLEERAAYYAKGVIEFLTTMSVSDIVTVWVHLGDICA